MSGAVSMNRAVNVLLASLQYPFCSFLCCFVLSSLGLKEALKTLQWCFTAVHTVHSKPFTNDHGPSLLKQQFWTAGESIIHIISLPTSSPLVPRLNPRLSSPKPGSLTGASSYLLIVNIDKHIHREICDHKRHCSLFFLFLLHMLNFLSGVIQTHVSPCPPILLYFPLTLFFYLIFLTLHLY